jgi:cytoskeletal protein CcmA (bactofilin family)
MFSKSRKEPVELATSETKSFGKSAVPSVISNDMKILGSVESRGDLQIDGTIEGDVASRTVTVSEGAIVRGSVSAESVRIGGTVKGGVNAKTVTLLRSAKVDGDITHQSLSIESGANFEGHVKRMSHTVHSETPKTTVGTGTSAEAKPAMKVGVAAE